MVWNDCIEYFYVIFVKDFYDGVIILKLVCECYFEFMGFCGDFEIGKFCDMVGWVVKCFFVELFLEFVVELR